MTHIITLLTDFGQKDSYVAQMKGVILGLTPNCHLVDISHEVPPQDISVAARMLREIVNVFPPETVHLSVVDPGVGTDRRIVAARLHKQKFVLPDNGLLELLLRDFVCEQAVAVENPMFWQKTISSTFHGRDVMAPVAARLAVGMPLSDLGPPINDLTRLEILAPKYEVAAGWLETSVVSVDHFGNAILDLPSHVQMDGQVRLWLKPNSQDDSADFGDVALRAELAHVVSAYGDAKPGDLIVLVGSGGCWEIAVTNGSAAQSLGLKRGQRVCIRLE